MSIINNTPARANPTITPIPLIGGFHFTMVGNCLEAWICQEEFVGMMRRAETSGRESMSFKPRSRPITLTAVASPSVVVAFGARTETWRCSVRPRPVLGLTIWE